tara:strand:- start:3423 stop:4241 length:819 start_codon:yes stop_codon:yes gene_type:complete
MRRFENNESTAFPGKKKPVAILILSLLAPAVASTTQAQEAGRSVSRMLEEVMVTARKREEGLQEAPIAISAFTGESLEARGITQLNDIQNMTPNLTFYNYTTEGAATNNASVFIRGVGQSDFAPTAEPGVGLYVDGVYIGRTVGSTLDLVDLERIEVLRGPQGTLFGRNTIGGALNVFSKKPHDELDGRAEVTVGTDNRLEGALYANVPLTDQLFSNFSLLHKEQDGYVTNITSGQDLGDTDTTGARVGLLWQPADTLEVRVSGDYSSSDQN